MSTLSQQHSENEKPLSAAEARALTNEQLSKDRQSTSSRRKDDARVARRVADKFMVRIKNRAANGHTDATCTLVEWQVKAYDRDEVYQQITRHIDSLGYNVLFFRKGSFWGSRAVFKIEW